MKIADLITNHMPYTIRNKKGKHKSPFKSEKQREKTIQHLISSIYREIGKCEHDFVGMNQVYSRCKKCKIIVED